MVIKVRLFAILKEMLGAEEIALELQEGNSCKDLLTHLEQRGVEMAAVLHHSMVAVNGCYADWGTSIHADDEVAILPPVSGG